MYKLLYTNKKAKKFTQQLKKKKLCDVALMGLVLGCSLSKVFKKMDFSCFRKTEVSNLNNGEIQIFITKQRSSYYIKREVQTVYTNVFFHF